MSGTQARYTTASSTKTPYENTFDSGVVHETQKCPPASPLPQPYHINHTIITLHSDHFFASQSNEEAGPQQIQSKKRNLRAKPPQGAPGSGVRPSAPGYAAPERVPDQAPIGDWNSPDRNGFTSRISQLSTPPPEDEPVTEREMLDFLGLEAEEAAKIPNRAPASPLISQSNDGVLRLKLNRDAKNPSPRKIEVEPKTGEDRIVPEDHPFAVLPRDLQIQLLQRRREREAEEEAMTMMVYGTVNAHFGKYTEVTVSLAIPRLMLGRIFLPAESPLLPKLLPLLSLLSLLSCSCHILPLLKYYLS